MAEPSAGPQAAIRQQDGVKQFISVQRAFHQQRRLAAFHQRHRLGRRRYELDLVTQFALSDVEATLRQAEYNMVTAVNDARVAQVKLARAMGYDLAKLLITP